MSATKLAFLSIAVVVLIGLGWQIICDTTAQNLASSAPADALEWSADESSALDVLARQELERDKPDTTSVQSWARASILHDPLDSKPLLFMGLAAEKAGDSEAADKLIRLAGQRSWRNSAAHLWLFQADIKSGEFKRALPHVDAVLRVQPELLPQFFPVIAAFTANSRSFGALTDFLAGEPPWREWVVIGIFGRLANRANVDRFYGDLVKLNSPPNEREFAAYLSRLIKDGRSDQAYQTWHAALSKGSDTTELLYNGDFSIRIDGLPFNWMVQSIPGAEISIVDDNSGRRALRVQFSGARVAFANVGQFVVLKPGRYRLQGSVRADRLSGPRGLWWAVTCAGSNAEIAHSDLISGTMGWTSFGTEFEIPTENCPAQMVRLVLPARIASEAVLEGAAWYRDLRIEPAAVSQ